MVTISIIDIKCYSLLVEHIVNKLKYNTAQSNIKWIHWAILEDDSFLVNIYDSFYSNEFPVLCVSNLTKSEKQEEHSWTIL